MRRVLLALIVGLVPLWGSASAQNFPTRPITMLVGLPPGGSVDMVARLYGELVGAQLGQRVVIEPRPGAGGIVAATALTQAQPDGHTLMLALGGLHTITPSLHALPFDPINDFQPITLLFSFPTFLTVPMDSPAKSVADLVALAAKKNGGLSFGAQGNGSPQHLIGIMLQQKTGMAMTTIGYKGGAPLVVDLAAGRLDFAFGSYAIMRPQLDDGRVRFLAIAAPARLPKLADVPTLAESGYPGVEVDGWFGLVAPRGTPPDIIAKLQAAFASAARDANLNSRLADEGIVVRSTTAQEMGELMRADRARFAQAIAAAGIKPEQ